jgi:quercetin 2,3-dioxygenase
MSMSFQEFVIAGELNGVKGPARTFTPLNVFDLRLEAGGKSDSLPFLRSIA